jgi:preprotein translocase subunit SecF
MKKYLKENKTLAVLLIVAVVCIVISIALLFKYFYFGNGGSKYGTRLEGIENVTISDESKNNTIKNLETTEKVEKASMTINGKRIDIKIVFKSDATLTEAQNIALLSLDNFTEEEKAFYDFEFTIKQEASETTEGFLLMGAKNVNGTNLVWVNNNSSTSKEE